MELTNSGILSLGVTPSAWYSTDGYVTLQVGNASLFGRNSPNSELYLGTNVFANSSGNPIYITSDFASRYEQNDGAHKWQIAPSGTAGNAITFTQAMTLTSGGNLLVGTTTDAGYKLDVNGTGRFSQNLTIGAATATTNVKLIFNGVASKAAGIEFHQSGTPQWYIGNGIASEDNNFELYNSNGTMAMKIIKSTNAINFIGAIKIANFTSNGLVGTDSSGNLGVVNNTYTEIATGTITYSMNSGAPWGINNSFPATIRDYNDDGMVGSAGVATSSNLSRGVTFDLGSAKAVRRIVERGYPTKNLDTITVQYSTDNSNWVTIHTYRHVYGNTQKDMEFNPTGAISARYWRWLIDGWTEREVQNYYTYEAIIYT
jgi:hypothetical protein